ncbi:putative ribosome biogenesis GTPase RsgA [compost metagenome]
MIKTSFPESWGWNAFFDIQVNTSEQDPSWHIARVINQEKNLYKLQVDLQSTKLGQISGKFAFENGERPQGFPCVGDWVLCHYETQDDRALIHQVLKRKSCFYRATSTGDQLVASNIDTVFVVSSANSDLSLNRLDRYLAVVWDSGASPVIVLSKTDLCEDLDGLMQDIETRHIGVPIVPVNMEDLTTLKGLEPYLKPASTSVLLGSSGVGKSTLTNALLGEDIGLTQGIREDDEKGRHTTTSRQLYILPQGALLMDTPGMRSLALSDHQDGLDHQFAEIVELAARCKFSDCRHETEPGCKIQAALESDELDFDQWQSYLKLQKEVYSAMVRKDRALLQQEQQKWKQISKDLRVRLKNKKKGII